MKKSILSLEGISVLTKSEMKNAFGSRNSDDLISGPPKYPKCTLGFGTPQTNFNCEMSCGTGYSMSLTQFNTCTHHN